MSIDIRTGAALLLLTATLAGAQEGRSTQDPRDLDLPGQSGDTFEDTGAVLGKGRGQSPVLQVRHDPVACVAAGRHPIIEAHIIPPEQVLLAHVLFRPEGTRDYYSVTMEKSGDRFWAPLPRPRPDAPPLQYYVEALDLAERAARSPQRTARVIAADGACASGAVATAVSSATLWVETPPGSRELPAGFSDDGVTVLGSRKIGVFRLSQGAALGAALLLGGGAYAALNHQAETAEGPPPSPIDPTRLFLVNSFPAPGSTVRLGATLTLSIQGSWTEEVIAGPVRAEFFVGEDQTPCAVVTGFHETLQRGRSYFMSVSGPVAPGACPLPITVTRLRVYVLDPAGAVAFQTGDPELPDQAVLYSITP